MEKFFSSLSTWIFACLLISCGQPDSEVVNDAAKEAINTLTCQDKDKFDESIKWDAEKYTNLTLEDLKELSETDFGAVYELGKRYHDGIGVDKDHAQSLVYYEQAAEGRVGGAAALIGYHIRVGDGYPASMEKAIPWYQKALNQGNPDVQFLVGKWYFHGENFEQSFEKARECFELSKASEKKLGNGYIAEMYLYGLGAPKSVEKALSIASSVVNTGDVRSSKVLGDIYMKGLGVDADPVAAANHYLKAEKGHDGDAALIAGKMFLGIDGNDIDTNPEYGLKLLKHAGEHGSAEGNFYAGYLLLQGSSVEQNVEEGLSLLEKSLAAGYVDAGLQLVNYYQSQGNTKEVERTLQASLDAGSEDAGINLALQYFYSDAYGRNADKALVAASKVEALGNDRGKALSQYIQKNLNYDRSFALPFCKALKECGFTDVDGTALTKAIYKTVDSERSGLDDIFIVSTKDGYGVLDRYAKIIIKPAYKTLKFKSTGKDAVFVVSNEKGYGLLDITGNEIISPQYGYIVPLENNQVLACKEEEVPFIGYYPNKCKLINRSNEILIPREYFTLTRVDNNLYAFEVDAKYGLITADNNILIPPTYDDINQFKHGYSRVLVGCKSSILCGAKSANNLYGVIDSTGKEVVPPIHDMISIAAPERFIVDAISSRSSLGKIDGVNVEKRNTKKKLINEKNSIIREAKYSFDRFYVNEGLVTFKGLNEKKKFVQGYFDLDGNVVIPPRFWSANPFKNGFAQVKSYNEAEELKSGVIDKTGRLVVSLSYDKVGGFTDGVAPIENSGLWGVVNDEGQEIVSPQYQKVLVINKNIIHVKKNELWGLIRSNGEVLLDPKYKKIINLSDGYQMVEKDNNNRAIVHPNGSIVSPFVRNMPTHFPDGVYSMKRVGDGAFGYLHLREDLSEVKWENISE